MNALVERKFVSEMQCGENFAYILNDNTLFSPTEYKVLQSHTTDCFVKTAKMMFNGHVQLYYLTKSSKPLSAMVRNMDAGKFVKITKNLLNDIIEVKSNGFLSCRNIDISPDRIYIDQETLKVNLVYLPLNKYVFDDTAAFESELRLNLLNLISEHSAISLNRRVIQLTADLRNAALSVEDIRKRLDLEVLLTNPEPEPASTNIKTETTLLSLVAINTPIHFEMPIVFNKPTFTIGKRDTNDGVISYNQMISRVHCRLTKNGNQYWITDLQSVNGTFVNGIRLQPNYAYQVKSGDIVKLADSEFQVVEKKEKSF